MFSVGAGFKLPLLRSHLTVIKYRGRLAMPTGIRDSILMRCPIAHGRPYETFLGAQWRQWRRDQSVWACANLAPSDAEGGKWWEFGNACVVNPASNLPHDSTDEE